MSGRRSVRVVRSVALALLAALAASCATPPPAGGDPLAGMPEDLTIDVEVRRGADARVLDHASRRGARYVLFADGTLHRGEGDVTGGDRLPPSVRVLSRVQVADVWTLAGQLGFTDPGAGTAPTNRSDVVPPADGITCLLQVRANGTWRQFVRASSGDAALDPAAAALVRRLSELAWSSDLPEATVRVQPRRYDFGPDPYARYRSR